jgi:flagellar biosynthesis/type III secretory pathway M-ring protein FliF/YscJ
LEATRSALVEAEQRDQVMTYGRLAALALGPVLLLIVLWFVLGGRPGRRVGKAKEISAGASPTPALPASASEAAAPGPASPATTLGSRPVAQVITEDYQKTHVRDQIRLLAKNNPSTLAQLIQTWIEEDRRN